MFRTPIRTLAPLMLYAVTLAGSSVPIGAQQVGDSAYTGKIARPHPRSVVLGIVGTVLGGLAAFGFSKGSGQRDVGTIALGAAAGGLAGFFVGRQLDERRAIAFHGTPELRIPNVGMQLEGCLLYTSPSP